MPSILKGTRHQWQGCADGCFGPRPGDDLTHEPAGWKRGWKACMLRRTGLFFDSFTFVYMAQGRWHEKRTGNRGL